MRTVTQSQPGRSLPLPPRRPGRGTGASAPAASPDNEGTYWCAAVGSSLSVIAGLAPHLDVMSASIVHLPERTAFTRPAVSAYLAMLKTVAGHWIDTLRPALLEAGLALASTGTGVTQGAARKGVAARTPGLTPALVRRMAGAVGQLEVLSAACHDSLEQMGRASRTLETDTIDLTQRLQADQVHALLLAQQASTLQSKLDDATMRQHAYWLLGPHAEQIRQEIAMHSSAREGVRRQLDHLRAEQAATQAEARYLQHLLPSLSTYLAAMDRLDSALRAALGGSRALLALWRTLPADASPGSADALAAAAPHWEALAATVGGLRRPPQGSGIMTPDGCRT